MVRQRLGDESQPSDTSTSRQVEARHLFSDSSSGAAQRVVPLFETEQDLNQGHKTMQTLLELPWYRSLVNLRDQDRVEVMIGYSDSAKDAGRFAAGSLQMMAVDPAYIFIGHSRRYLPGEMNGYLLVK